MTLGGGAGPCRRQPDHRGGSAVGQRERGGQRRYVHAAAAQAQAFVAKPVMEQILVERYSPQRLMGEFRKRLPAELSDAILRRVRSTD